jgi:RNA polymerase sigma factor (sigma-70 family)
MYSAFPLTRHSIVLAAQSGDPAVRSPAIDAIAAAYWRPVYKYLRLKWNVSSEDAADFTQDFFANLLEKEILNSYDSRKGRLRTFLRTCADRLFMNRMRDSQRLRRNGGHTHLELTEAQSFESPEDHFDKEWVRSLFTLGLERLQRLCESEAKMIHLQLFELYDLGEADPQLSYNQLAAQFGLAVTDVTNYLAFARREFRRCVLDQLREMTTTEQEFRREAQLVLGIRIK